MLPRTVLGRVVLGLGVLLLAAMPSYAPGYYVELGTYAMISAMLALSLQLLVGCTGLVSLGHAAFYGLAAYTVYLITPAGRGLSILVTLPAAIAVAGLAALVVGALSLRTKGFFFLMVTLAFGQMVFDKDRSARLVECLKRYKRHTPKHGEPSAPVHDQYSHGADNYRYISLVADQLTNDDEHSIRTPYRAPIQTVPGFGSR